MDHLQWEWAAVEGFMTGHHHRRHLKTMVDLRAITDLAEEEEEGTEVTVAEDDHEVAVQNAAGMHQDPDIKGIK
jgi:hypothetical protein